LIWHDLHAAILGWYHESGRDLPWRGTSDAYAVLVSEVMLQQTQVDRVLPKYQAFLACFPNFAALAAAPPADVIRAWQGLGYNRRAVRLQRIAKEVIARFSGRLPDTVAGLLALDGIGRYTAAAIACFAFGRPEPVLDTNVRRVLGRIVLGPDGPATASPAALWKLAEEALPPGDAYDWNQALMDLGARVCLERNPTCLVCPARQWCASAGRVGVTLRERSARYSVKAPARFTGSSRFYRGRIVEQLRGLAPGATLPLSALGSAVRPEFGADDEPWLLDLVSGLARDGLLVIGPDRSVSLP
jgi:A/G-specific adenine glycosylase